MLVEKRQQQNFNVRAVHVGIGHDADLAVTKIRNIGFLTDLMWIHADRYRNIVNFFITEKKVLVHFPCVQHLAAKRKNGLIFFIASLLC